MNNAPIHNYTGYGSEGSLYAANRNLRVKEIAAIVRKQLRSLFPDCMFSVTSDYQNISIYLMKAPFKVFNDPTDRDTGQTALSKEYASKGGHSQINHYYLEDNDIITEDAKAVLGKAASIAGRYNYRDTDSQIDYFDTNFYLEIGIGKHDKPFVQS